MANQRSRKKKFVGGYVDYKVKHAIQAAAIEAGKSVTEVVEGMLKEGVERYSATHPTASEKPVNYLKTKRKPKPEP